MPSAVTSGGADIIANIRGRSGSPIDAHSAPSTSDSTSASPATRAAASGLPSPCRRDATAVTPTFTISATDTINQIQNTAIDAAARPVAPTRVPIQNVSTEVNSVISSDDAIAGSATRAMVRGSGSETRWTASHSLVTATGVSPSCGSSGRDAGMASFVVSDARGSGERRDLVGDRAQCSRRRGARVGGDDRRSGVASLHHARIERHLPEQWELDRFRQPLAASGSEQRARLAAVWALEPAHVLDDAEHRHADPLEHLHPTQRVADAHLLRRGDDDRTIHLGGLHE